jgi:hypothetical protein
MKHYHDLEIIRPDKRRKQVCTVYSDPFYHKCLRSINYHLGVFSISLDSTIDPAHKRIRSQEPNSSSQKTIDSACQT